MNVNVTGSFIYFTIPIFGGIPITQTTVSSLVVAILQCSLSIYLGKGLKNRPDGKQVLYTSDESGYEQIYLVRLPEDLTTLPMLETLSKI